MSEQDLDDTGTKECPDCGEIKPLSMFPLNKAKTKHAKYCRECVALRRRGYEIKRREKTEKWFKERALKAKNSTPVMPDVPTGLAYCHVCNRERRIYEFPIKYRNVIDKNRQRICTDCSKEIARRKRQEKREQKSTEKNNFLSSLPYKERVESIQRENFTRHLKLTYGISAERYNSMFAMQNGLCAICGNPPEQFQKLFVDHNHTTGCVRGLLCRRCNLGLGYFRDNLVNLQNAIEYLKKSTWD